MLYAYACLNYYYESFEGPDASGMYLLSCHSHGLTSANIVLLLENTTLQPHLDELPTCYRIPSERSAGRDVDGLFVIGQGDRGWF